MKPCTSCTRKIDQSAKLCPFCNWDQNESAPPRVEMPVAPAVEATAPPAQPNPWRNRILIAAGGAALLVIIFVIGALVHGVEPSDTKSVTTTTASSAKAPTVPEPRANIELVPDSAAAPITSAADNGDATALGSNDYAQLAQRARTETAAPQAAPFVDPRTIGVNGAAPPVRQPDIPMASATQPQRVTRTEPIPVYQPVPSLHIGNASTRLYLTVGSDGHVKDIDISRPLPAETVQLISAVQNWRFRPATENGIPVAARFSVDITFHGNE